MEDLRVLEASSPLAQALQRGRERYNATARRQGRRIDAVGLALWLADGVAPVVDAVERVASIRTDAVTEALFDLSLDLLPREVVGGASRHPRVVEAWKALLPRLARRVADEPQRVVASITNAAFHLGQEPSARPEAWLADMAALGPGCDSVDVLLTLGQVLAWRSGLAHYRETALEAWDRLPDALAFRALGLPATSDRTRAQVRDELSALWREPGAAPEPPALRVVARVGGFRGFGGPFLSPPRVFVAHERIWAADEERAFSLHADCFGQTLQPAAAPPAPESRAGVARLERSGLLSFDGLEASLPALAGATGFAAAGGVVAVTLPRSHRILLVARTGDRA